MYVSRGLASTWQEVKQNVSRLAVLMCGIVLLAQASSAKTVSPLLARGYTVAPEPQQVYLTEGDFSFGSGWRLRTIGEVSSQAIEDLAEDLETRYQVHLGNKAGAPATLILEIQSHSLVPGSSLDRDKQTIAEQAYRIHLEPTGIRITANADAGLFYGIQTFVQLLKARQGSLWLPQGEIVDWPDLGLRQIYWDDAHHLEKLSSLKAAVREAAFFKINGFVLKLEGHFEYRSAPYLVEPQALRPAELQELTSFGLRYHVQVIPYLDAPAHIAFILKHPEYSKLRAFPDSNYELCTTNPAALKLLEGMYDDLLAANKGGKYFYLSTDEAYYVGLAHNSQCAEAGAAQALGGPGRLLAQFVTKAASYLHDRGREVVFWGEYPLKPDDIRYLPNYLINGETYGSKFDKLYGAQGIRQMIYNSTEGEERLFPHYSILPPERRVHALEESEPRIADAVAKIVSDSARKDSELMGLIIAGWGDMGLHPETFWLGYAAITAAGWRPPSGGMEETAAAFYPLFYGPDVVNMSRVYQLLSYQAEVWMDSWETIDSQARTPIWGNSYKIYEPRKPARDQAIPLPPVPSETLHYEAAKWTEQNAARLRLAGDALPESEELVGLLQENLRLAHFNRYNLEVFLSIAQLCRQNLDFLRGLSRVDGLLKRGAAFAGDGKAVQALEAEDGALTEIRQMKAQRDRSLADATETWEKSWLPRVEKANGRTFLHEVDDVKDHLPDRTVDMSYLIYRELQLPLDDWYGRVQEARNRYANANHLAASIVPLDWQTYLRY